MNFDSKWNDCINQMCADWRDYKRYKISRSGVFWFLFLCLHYKIKISKFDPTGDWESAQLKTKLYSEEPPDDIKRLCLKNV